jgi:hypothetical protein
MAPARAATGTARCHTRPHPVINQQGDTLMTTTTTTTAAASNGSTDTDAATAEATGQPDKPFGMAGPPRLWLRLHPEASHKMIL